MVGVLQAFVGKSRQARTGKFNISLILYRKVFLGFFGDYPAGSVGVLQAFVGIKA